MGDCQIPSTSIVLSVRHRSQQAGPTESSDSSLVHRHRLDLAKLWFHVDDMAMLQRGVFVVTDRLPATALPRGHARGSKSPRYSGLPEGRGGSPSPASRPRQGLPMTPCASPVSTGLCQSAVADHFLCWPAYACPSDVAAVNRKPSYTLASPEGAGWCWRSLQASIVRCYTTSICLSMSI